MSTIMTIELPERTKAALDKAVREEGVSESNLVTAALEDYLFVRRFRSLRDRLTAETNKSYTDDEIFGLVS